MVRDESVQMMQADVGVGTADLEIGRGYVKQLQIVWRAAQCLVCGLGLVKLSREEKSSGESSVDDVIGATVGVGCPGGTAQGTYRPGTRARRSCGPRADRAR